MNGNIFRIGLLFYLGVFAFGHHHGEIINTHGDVLSGVHIDCNTHDIKVTVSTSENGFHGMIYPKGLSKNSSCLAEYTHAGSNIVYSLPLRSCNTMNHEVDDAIEFVNTIVVQPHSKLVTSNGRGFHVRCRYQMNNSNVNSPGKNLLKKDSVPLPNCHMKIYKGRIDEHVIAENVKIGDYLTLAINIDNQDTYGIKVTNCLVKDGLNLSEEPIINNEGCPINEDIVGAFEYTQNLTMATVTYPAHKFPLTNSIYYQCNVKLCVKKSGDCEDVPPVCDKTGQNVRLHRRKRQNEVEDSGNLNDLRLSDEDLRDKSVEVYSGLLVNEVDELSDEIERPSSLPSQNEEDFCLSTRKFAIGIAIAGVLLMLAVIFLVACIIFRRRRRKGTSTTGSSIYSGPYSNHAYSRD